MTTSPRSTISAADVLESSASTFAAAKTHASGPSGSLPITPEILLTQPSGNLFGLSQNAGMGWEPSRLLDPEFLILSTHGGVRAPDGTPVALGFHTGHWEVGLLVEEAARELRSNRATPFAGACTDPCDGRTQGTAGMLDSLPYRNDAAIVLRRLMRSLPTRKGVIGVALTRRAALAIEHSRPGIGHAGDDAVKTRAQGPAREHALGGGRHEHLEHETMIIAGPVQNPCN